jgi:hypothetical protein
MSETTTISAPAETVETAREGALKRFAKAFYAKVRKAASAIKAVFVHTVGDNETIVDPSEGLVRKTLRYVTAVPKWIGHVLVFVVRTILFAVLTVAALAVALLGAVVGVIVSAAYIVAMTVYKIVQGIALLARTPYLLVRGDDCLATDYEGYGNLWKPKYFYLTTISQVFAAQLGQATEADVDSAVDRHPASGDQPLSMADVVTPAEHTASAATLTLVHGGQEPKGYPTPKQSHRRPRRLPKPSPATA